MTRRRATSINAAEAIAIGICITERLVGQAPFGDFDANMTKYHPGRCRWCATDKDKLLAKLTEFGIAIGHRGVILNDDAQAAYDDFNALDGKVRWRRIREAQETAWYEGVALR
jgi:hypothetical protein